MRFVRFPAEREVEHGETDDVGQGDVPAVTQPVADRLGFRIHVGKRDAGRRAEPDHRTAKTDGIGQNAPVVAALLERQRGERDVVEYRRDKTQAERHQRRGGRQFLDRHHRRTGDQREQEDRSLEGFRQHFPVRPPNGNREQDRHPHGNADKGEVIGQRGELHIDHDVGDDGEDQNQQNDADACLVDPGVSMGMLDDRRIGVLLLGAKVGSDAQGDHCGAIGVEYIERADTVDPHHRRRRVADHRAGAAGVGGGDNRRQVADMHLGLEQLVRHGAADQRGGDVVEEAGEHENHHQHHEPALPVVGQILGQDGRDVALFEVAREQGKTHEQAEQVGQHHPFVLEVPGQAGRPVAGLETGEQQFVKRDRRQAGQPDVQRVVVKQRNAEQGQRKENEVERDAGDHDQFAGRGGQG